MWITIGEIRRAARHQEYVDTESTRLFVVGAIDECLGLDVGDSNDASFYDAAPYQEGRQWAARLINKDSKPLKPIRVDQVYVHPIDRLAQEMAAVE